MNTEAMPLKHEHCHHPPCGATPPMEEEAVPFPATTATTKTRVTRAALVLCVVAAVVYCKLVKPQSDAAGGLLREGSGEWIPIPNEQLACSDYWEYVGCLNGFLTPDGLWVFDVDSDNRPTDRDPHPPCDDIPGCEQFCYDCADSPIKAGACSADGQYFCFPGGDDDWYRNLN